MSNIYDASDFVEEIAEGLECAARAQAFAFGGHFDLALRQLKRAITKLESAQAGAAIGPFKPEFKAVPTFQRVTAAQGPIFLAAGAPQFPQAEIGDTYEAAEEVAR